MVLVLVALIVGVAWSQFGELFDTSTAGTGVGPQGGGIRLDGTSYATHPPGIVVETAAAETVLGEVIGLGTHGA